MANSKIETTAGFQLAKIFKLKRRYIDLAMKSLGLSRSQWLVLMYLSMVGPCTQKELLQHVDIDAAHLARVLEDFSNQKYIVRTPVEGDRRCLYVEVTSACKRSVVAKIEKAILLENEILLKGLKASEKNTLFKLLSHLENNIASALILELEKNLERENE